MTTTPIRARDLAERVFWTVVAAGLVAVPSAITATTVGDADAWVSLGLTVAALALVALVNAVLVIARWRLSVLPNPGEGLPGLPD